MYTKDFDGWNNEKKGIHETSFRKMYICRGEIWYVKLGYNVGYEQDGKAGFKRPVLVLNQLGSMFLVVPMTTKGKDSQYYQKLESVSFSRNSYIILSQIRVIDQRRFIEHIGSVSFTELQNIKKNLSIFCFSD